jgi:hypothetical protein
MVVPAVSLSLVAAFACKKEPSLPPPPAALAKSSPHSAISVDGAKALLTEDKVTRFATYQKEITGVTADAVGIGLAAYQKGAADPKSFEKAAARDDRSAKIAAASEAALKKSGLSQNEVTTLTRVLTPYYTRVYVLGEGMAKLMGGGSGDGAGKGKPNLMAEAMAKATQGNAAQLETMRKDFAKQYGAEALALVQKHEPEFMVINEKMMGAAMGAMTKKP